jgi:hypothetical protein
MTTAADLGMAPILLPNGDRIWVRAGEPLAKATIPVGEPAVTATALAELARTLGTNQTTLGPGAPIPPGHTDEGAPRRWDYRIGTNLPPRPRNDETYSFETLRGFIRNYDIARLCIEKRKDDLRSLTWSVRPRPVEGMTRAERIAQRRAAEDAINEATGFLLTPDQEIMWGPWLMKWAHDLFSIDAATIYLRPTLGGELYGLEVVDGATIKVLLDQQGRLPQAPEPAYVQIVKGMPWGWYTRDQIVYAPYWPTSTSPYGSPPIEWVMMAANRALRRQTMDLARFTDGNIPTALLKIPAEWSDARMQEYTEFLTLLMAGNDQARARFMPVPDSGGTNPAQVLNTEAATEGERWLLHITCWAYGVNPSEIGFVDPGSGMGGKGFAEVGQALSFRRSVRNTALHLKGIMDSIFGRVPRWAQLELFCSDLEQSEDTLEKAQADKIYWGLGGLSTDEIREDRLDRDAIGLGPTVVTSQNTVQLVSDLLEGPEQVPDGLVPFAGESPSVPIESQSKAQSQAQAQAEGAGTPGDTVPDAPSAAPGKNTASEKTGTPSAEEPIAAEESVQKVAGIGDDLAAWQRKSLKAIRAGRSPLVRFESDAIPEPMAALVNRELAKCSSAQDIRETFGAAARLARLAKAGGESGRPLAAPRPSSAISSPTGSPDRAASSWNTSGSGRRLYP